MTNKTVTMSRELIEQLQRSAESMGWSISDDLSSALAAPVVERQEPIGYVDFWDLDRMAKGSAHWATLWDSDGSNNPSRGGDSFALYAEQPAPVAVVNIRNFANAMIDIALEGADADGGHIQELAIKHGLLKPEQRTERCGDACSCAEYADFPVECFRKVKELNQ